MGLDLWAVPVRLDTAPLRAMRAGADAWEEAADHPPFASSWGEPAPPISREILERIPDGFAGAVLPLPSRSHDQAEYFLDPVAYRTHTSWEERERSLPHRIIRGDREFAEHATSGIGVPWRCSTSAFLAEAAALIDAIDPVAIRQEFSVAEMVDLGVYKTRPDMDDDETFVHVLADLRELARYHHRLVDHGLDLVLTLI